ncbi:hypothetical protein L227DRAFT_547024 [Lentinus tigrinus ALCF2SS1-6]|uniref:Bromodomain associated domain-containing protein n=1 Tax=Lentinus tigrinus ALCF2SS1-6 TaxID=1328759 RepID=A0A5C2SBT3_9APHY|nr:hypothetical protein L227DRAFT_547024 [Lentinus tigrinus ALCF2SS1-6]
MDSGAKKILESVTLKVLHAHGFSKASTQANLVFADLLSRYLSIAAATVGQYAEHAGRRRIVPQDAVNAFGDMGTSVEELQDYCEVNGRDMARYAVHSSKRLEELNEFRAQLAVGLSHDEDDVTHLEWGLVPDALASEEEDESEYEEIRTPSDDVAKSDVMLVDTEDPDAEGEEDVHVSEHPDGLLKDSFSRRRSTPPLPLSPISNPRPRKRQRTEKWQPPEYIPDWLPPFPTAGEPQQATPAPAAPSDPAAMPNGAMKAERPATPPLQAQVSTASSSADYHTVVPYDQSTLASVPTWHLPSEFPPNDTGFSKPELLLPGGQQVLLEGYHHILTHPPPARVGAVNPGRYRVALALVQQMEKYNRWDAPTTLYGSTAPNPPRVAAMPPSYALPISKKSGAGTPDGNGSGKESGEKEDEKRALPSTYARHLVPPESITPMLSRSTSRIPGLAKDILPQTVYIRSSRVQHPPVLLRGGQKLLYGNGVNASWNSSFNPTPAATPAAGKGKDGAVNGMANGKDKGGDKGADGEKPRALPDARFYATWNYEQKRYDEPLVVRRRVGSIAVPPMGKARSESTNS